MAWHAGLVAGGQLRAALIFVSTHPDALLLIFLLSLAATLGVLILPLCTTWASYAMQKAITSITEMAEMSLETCVDRLVVLHHDKSKCSP